MAEREFGPYRLVRQIAVGGMAEIHLAKTKGIAGFEKYIALKMIHPNFAEDDEFIQMLVDEAKIAVQLNHANIAQTFDLGRVGDTFYITMEYVDGADLYKILRRASEIDVDMPLEVAAFIAKEVAFALDHAHKKRDPSGKQLGIVHRDVSPQNVLVSYNGEVKLVDFGIAKATMKVKQTAVGVIKGKYYYMSPEQARGDPIDYRSDIFSAGIVLYEMITGQMLYLEEDLHKLLDMARRADIAPPSTLRRGVPPQLERIVMHALAKSPGDRYQSAGDFATDLERFLHAYSPISTSSKVSALIRQVLGDPQPAPDAGGAVERRDGPLSTHELSSDDIVHSPDELRDENSMIFSIGELREAAEAQAKSAPPAVKPRAMTGPPAPSAPSAPVVAAKSAPQQRKPRARDEETREVSPVPDGGGEDSGLLPVAPPKSAPASAPIAQAKQPRPAGKTAPMPAVRTTAPGQGAPQIKVPASVPSVISKSNAGVAAAPAGKPRPKMIQSSTLVKPSSPPVSPWDTDNLETDSGNELDNIGERTMITAAPGGFAGGGFMIDDGGGDGVESTVVSSIPSESPSDGDGDGDTNTSPFDEDDLEDQETMTGRVPQPSGHDSDEPPTIQRDFASTPGRRVTVRRPAAPPPAALSAKIQAPAVSELRKPRASRKTPGAGVPVPNVLQQIVGHSSASAPMPSPRAQTAPPEQSFTLAMDSTNAGMSTSPGVSNPSSPTLYPIAPAPPAPQASSSYNAVAPPPDPASQSGGFVSPLAAQTPAPGAPMQMMPGVPPHLQPYANQGQPAPYGYPQVSPSALYQMHPYGSPTPPAGMPAMTPTGALRLFEADDLPQHLKMNRGVPAWLKVGVAGAVAVGAAAGVTFFIIRSMQHGPRGVTVHVQSDPAGADVYFDGNREGVTPLDVPNTPAGKPVEIRVEAMHRKPYVEMYQVPADLPDVTFSATLKPLTGKLVVVSKPDGAEVRIDGDIRGRTPATINDVDIEHAKKVELRLKDYQPYSQQLAWPASGEIDIDAKLVR